MADVNHVILIGRLTRDAEIKYTSGGMAVCKFAIAVNKKKKQGDQYVDEANFFDVVLWGKQGESINHYLVKGKQVAVEGELHQNRWEQDGQSRSKVEINADNVQLLGGTGSQESGQREPRGASSTPPRAPRDQAPPSDDSAPPAGFPDDEVPF